MVDTSNKGRFRWTIAAFLAAFTATTLMLAWQLYESTPARWCAIGAVTTKASETSADCYTILLKLLDNKNTLTIGLLSIQGICVLSLAAIALGLKIQAAGPGGTSVDISADTAVVSAENVISPPAQG